MRTSEDKPAAPVALVTGASGGLGQGVVRELLAQGWRVAAGGRQTQVFPAGPQLLPVRLEVTEADSARAAVGAALERWGRLDLLINNAGLARDKLLAQTSAADWEAVLAVNLKGAFLCAQAVAEPMVRQRSGQIINISSHAGRQGARGQAAYAAAKAGLLGLTASLARELGRHNVRVNAVLPGVLPTGMTSDLSAEQLRAFAAANALGRLNDLGEVARFLVFLAGTRNISGQLFQLDSRISRWT